MPDRLKEGSEDNKKISYSKTKPPIIEDFDELSKWCNNKVENEYAWKVDVKDVIKTNDKGEIEINLDIHHPSSNDNKPDLSPHELIKQIITDEKKTLELLEDVEKLIKKEIPQ